MTHLLTIFITALSLTILVKAYPDGAPEEDGVCDTLRPGHRMVEHDESTDLRPPLSGAPFFSIHIDKTEVRPGDIVTVTIKADEEFYEGFIIQARDVNEKISDSNVVTKYGTFHNLTHEAKPLCNMQAMTHAIHEHFTEMTFNWKAPATKVENVHFKATVVRNYERFFMNVRSDVMNPTDASVLLVPSLTLLFITTILHAFNFNL